MAKSRDAFRTISEVSEWLDIPAHVLRFWESRFNQIKPVKRAGGRRYYRPNDMQLLGGIRRLLHEDGITIKGVQKILREKGVKHVSALSLELESGPIKSTEPPENPQKIETAASQQSTETLTASYPISEAFKTAQHPIQSPNNPDSSAILPDILAVGEIDEITREDRVFALYQRLLNLRNRVYQGMVNE